LVHVGLVLEVERLEHGQPRSMASSLTGGGVQTCPRPQGRSGWLYTPTISQPSHSRRCFRDAAAKSGVPMNTIFNLLFLFQPFFELSFVQGAFQFADLVDEQHAIEMVHLVLQADGQEVVGVHFHGVAVQVSGREVQPLGPVTVVR
jgi:hypothetical protein